MYKHLVIATTALLTACTAPADRLAMPTVASQLELRPLVGSVMVRTVSLPTYAAAEDIALQVENGLIVVQPAALWADEPQRTATLALTRNLSDILNTDVGPDPWPFIGLPDVTVDVRVEHMIADASGSFRLAGHFYIGGDGINFPNSVRPFAINEPMSDTGLQSIASAQARALLLLSEQIAKSLAR